MNDKTLALVKSVLDSIGGTVTGAGKAAYEAAVRNMTVSALVWSWVWGVLGAISLIVLVGAVVFLVYTVKAYDKTKHDLFDDMSYAACFGVVVAGFLLTASAIQLAGNLVTLHAPEWPAMRSVIYTATGHVD